MKIRSFISVDVSIKDAINGLQNRIMLEEAWKKQQIKLVEKENLHFSIIFLGEITEEAIEMLKSSLSDLIFSSFTLSYRGLGVFPNIANARIVWMGTDPEGGKKLSELSKKVLASISHLGFTPDKPFIPHVTLFRIKNKTLITARILSKYGDLTFGSDLIDRIRLKKSELTPSGPIYSDLFTVYLR